MDLIAFDQEDFSEAFVRDLQRAQNCVYLRSPYIADAALERLVAAFKELVARGVRVCVYLQRPDYWDRLDKLTEAELDKYKKLNSQIKALESILVHVTLRNMIHEKIIVIDLSVVWSGSLNSLSYNPKRTTDAMTRVVDVRHAAKMNAMFDLDICERCMDCGFPSRSQFCVWIANRSAH